LTPEELEQIAALIEGPQWKALNRLLDRLGADFVKEVIGYNLNEGPEGLVIRKARLEGVEKLRARLRQIAGERRRPKP
jgi:hypothetical protein